MLSLLLGNGSVIASNTAGSDDLFEMSLGELLTLQITSAGKKAEPLSQAAAAVFVITEEDIRRSGVTTVPEALRMAPGLQVARIDANKWAISARGFNGRFANKLLVMIDGRSVYTPQFSGVYWDVQSPPMEDIERIEVIRGPGATLWGSNAVNGVINIITKSSADTQGGRLTAIAGTEERAGGSLRWGGPVGGIGHYRVYGEASDRDGTLDVLGRQDNADDWNGYKTGFRADLVPGERDALLLQGNFYQGRHGETVFDQASPWPNETTIDLVTDIRVMDLSGQWSRRLSDTDDVKLQSYYQRTERDWARLGEDRDTFDIELEYRTQRLERNDFIMGLGYRYTRDQTLNTEQVSLDPSEDVLNLFSAFIQDDISLIAERLTLTLGAKLEHNDFTGFEVQPNLRLLWTPSERQTLWASLARAVRTPGRGEVDGVIRQGILDAGSSMNPSPYPIDLVVYGNEDLASEDLLAYEAGYRWQVDPSFSFDLSVFYNDYKKLRSSLWGGIRCKPEGRYPTCLYGGSPVTGLLIPVELDNTAEGDSHGLEWAFDWRPLPAWRLQGAYSYLAMNTEAQDGYLAADDPDANPTHQWSLRSWLNPRPNIDFDLWLRYTDVIGATIGFDTYSIDPYWELDARLAWRPAKRLELSLVGQNLLNDAHVEGFSELGDLSLANIERSVYFMLRLDF